MKLIIFELSLNMTSNRVDQITCQMLFFKHYFSFIFLVSILIFSSCKNIKNEYNDYNKEIVNISESEIKLHKDFLKKELKKNFY